MSDDNQNPLWPIPLCILVGVACVAVPWLHLRAVATIYQAVGVVFTFLGLASIGDWLRRVTDATLAALGKLRLRIGGWIARLRARLAAWWAKIAHRPRSATIHAASAHSRSSMSGTFSAEVKYERVDRDKVSDREWLAILDDRVASLLDRLDAAEQQRAKDREDFQRRLGIQRNELRAEIVREARNGWQLVAWGLGYTFVGVVLGFA